MNTSTKEALLGLSADGMIALTILASLPYELGEVGIIVPSDWKPWVSGIGLAAMFILRMVKRWTELKAAK